MNYKIYKLSGEEIIFETEATEDACVQVAQDCAAAYRQPVALVIDDGTETYICTSDARGVGFYDEESAMFLHAMSIYDADSWDLIEHIYDCEMFHDDMRVRGIKAAKERGRPVIIDYFGDQWMCEPDGLVSTLEELKG